MRNLVVVIFLALMLVSCGSGYIYTYYYNYEEVIGPQAASNLSFSRADSGEAVFIPFDKYAGYFQKDSPTRCVGVYSRPDGTPVYVMETKVSK